MSEQPINEFREIDAAPLKAKGTRDGDLPEDVLNEGLTRFQKIVSREEHSRVLGVEDLVFVDQEGGQHEDFVSTNFLSGDTLTSRSSDNKPPPPKYQIDRITPVIEESTSDQRESQININVRSTGQTADKGLNDTFNGLIKNIEVVSDAQDAYDNAYDECQKSGYGGWQIVTEYVDNSFDQGIAIEPILNATQSLFFGPAKKATKEDALYAFLIWDIDKEEFKATYPDAEATDWPEEVMNNLNKSWFNSADDMIRLAAYWRKRPIKKEIAQLVDGRVVDAEQLPIMQEVPGGEPVEIAVAQFPDGKPMIREVDTYQVERFIMNGVEVLKGPQEWAGKYIPLIPEYGIRSVVNGQEIIRGRVRKGKDAQRIYNYGTSAIIETAALSPKDFYWMTDEMMDGHIDELETLNVDQPPVQGFKPDPEFPGQFPQKASGPVVQQALIAQVAQAREDISASIGAGVGVTDGTAADPRSGEAIREGNVNKEKGNSIYFNNHIRAIRYTGKQLADLIPKIVTTETQQRIIKPDGTEDFVTVNQVDVDFATGKKDIVTDLRQVEFDTSVDVGPAYASQRQQGADQLTKLAVDNPAFAQHTPDLIAKSLDIPGAKELEKRLRRAMVTSGQAEPTDEEREEFGIDLRAQIAQELEPQLREQITNEANIRLIDANTNQLNAQAGNFAAGAQQKEVETQKTAVEIAESIEDVMNKRMDGLEKAIDANAKLQESMLQKIAAGIQPSINEIDNLNSQDDIIEEQQQEVSPGPNSSQITEFGIPPNI